MGTTAWTWETDRILRVRDLRFFAATSPLGMGPDDLLVIKPPSMVDRYLTLIEAERPGRIVELGIKDGGSTALIAAMADGARVLGIDLAPDVPDRLARLLGRDADLRSRLTTSLGIDQADRVALAAAVDAAFPEGGLDLVVDDASHILGPTRASFDVLFPRLRPGGLFVVEDWQMDLGAVENARQAHPADPPQALLDRVRALAHVLLVLNDPQQELPPDVLAAMTEAGQERLAEGGSAPLDLFGLIAEAVDRAGIAPPPGPIQRPLADLAVELTLVAATRPDLVAEVRVDNDWVTVRRGPAPLDLDGFALGDAWTDAFGYLR